MTPESWNSAVRRDAETVIARQRLGNYVFQLSLFCAVRRTANRSPQFDRRENTASNISFAVCALSLCLCVLYVYPPYCY
jgi:hypothetical protein